MSDTRCSSSMTQTAAPVLRKPAQAEQNDYATCTGTSHMGKECKKTVPLALPPPPGSRYLQHNILT